jgi:RNA-binding protein
LAKKKKVERQEELSGRAARHLRALGHALDPIVAIGKTGITDALVKQTAGALLQHELVKVRVMSEAPVDRKEAATELAEKTYAAVAQVLGRTFLLYKRHPEKPRIVLPRERKQSQEDGKTGS